MPCRSSLRLAQSGDEEADQSACVVARIAVRTDAEVAHASHQLKALKAGADLAATGRGVEQLVAHGHEPVEEVGVQRVETGVVGLQHGSESVLGDQEVDEEVDPLPQRGVRSGA